MARKPIPTWFYAVVVVQKGDRFLLIHERQHGQLWYLPSGRVEFGEELVVAAQREALEESGVPVRIEGVIRIEHSPRPDSARLRVIFFARPIDDTPPKTVADEESLGATWVSLDELPQYDLRGDEVPDLLRYVAAGGAVYPVELIRAEGMAFKV